MGGVLIEYEEFLSDTTTCFVSFASMGEGDHGGCHFEWRKTLHDGLGASMVLMRDRFLHWYQDGVAGIGDIDAVVAYIRDLGKRYRVVTVGLSMGGFGALLFGILAQVPEIIALVPQTRIGEDERWVENWAKITYAPQPDIAQLLPCKSQIRVFIGEDDPDGRDRAQAKRLLPHAPFFIVPDTDHSGIAPKMRDSGFFRGYAI